MIFWIYDVFHILKSFHDAYYQVKRKLSKSITEAADIEEKAKTRSPQERTLKRYIELVDEVIPENQNLIDQMDTIIQWIGELIAFPGYSIEDSVSLINWCLDMLLVLAKDYSKLRAEIHKFREKIDTTLAYLHKFYGYMEREAQKQDVPYELLTQVYYLRRFDASSQEYSEGWARLHAAYGYDNALLGKAFTIVETLCRTTKRASSLVENLNSRIRPFLNDKRGMTDYHAQLMRMFLNYRKYPRSRLDFRKGKSPIEILLGTEENFDFFEALGISAPKIITV